MSNRAPPWSIILLLKDNGVMTQVGLANYLNIEPPAITNSLNKLEKKGFIERKPGVDKRELLSSRAPGSFSIFFIIIPPLRCAR